MITHAIQDWYRDDNDELICEDTGYVVEWHTDRDKLTCGTYGVLYAEPDADILTTVSYCDNTWTPYYNYFNGIMYETLADLMQATLDIIETYGSRDAYYLSQND